MTKRATTSGNTAIYVRISDDREGTELGVERQEEDCRKLAAQQKLQVVRVYSDNDRGASTRSTKPRPGYAAMVADAEAGKLGAILAYSSSRLTRRPMELEGQIELAERYGVRYMYLKSPSFDLNTADGRAVARTVAAWDAAEAERTAERVSRQARQRAERGGSHGGLRGYGMPGPGVSTATVEAEQAVIREVAEALLAGVSLRQASADLNRRGVSTATGKGRWSGGLLRRVLLKPRLAGILVHDGHEVGRLPGKAVLPEEQWRALVDMLTDDTRPNSGMGRPAKWLGSGLYRCACGGLVEVGTREAYRCRSLRDGESGGEHIRRSATAVDAYVAELVVERLSRPDAADLFPQPAGVDLGALRRTARALRTKKARLAERYGADEIDEAEYDSSRKANAAKLAEVEAELAAAVRTSPLAPLVGAEDVRAVWEALSLGQQREIVATLLRVTILPTTRRGRGFDTEAVRIEWC